MCAFARQLDAAEGRPEQIAIVVVPRLLMQLTTASEKDAPATTPIDASVWERTSIVLPTDMLSVFKNGDTGPLHAGFPAKPVEIDWYDAYPTSEVDPNVA